MATPNAFDVQIDVRSLEGLADNLGLLGGEAFGAAGVAAVNDVATRTRDKVQQNIVGPINLPTAYVEQRLSVRYADNPGQPVAVVYSPFQPTQLGRYDPKPLMVPVKHPDRAKGDPRRGIPKGMKAAGISVEVVRGDRKDIAHGFILPTSIGPVVATRWPGDPKYQSRLGPAVYQLASVQFGRMEEEIGIDLQIAVLQEAERVIEGVFP